MASHRREDWKDRFQTKQQDSSKRVTRFLCNIPAIPSFSMLWRFHFGHMKNAKERMAQAHTVNLRRPHEGNAEKKGWFLPHAFFLLLKHLFYIACNFFFSKYTVVFCASCSLSRRTICCNRQREKHFSAQEEKKTQLKSSSSAHLGGAEMKILCSFFRMSLCKQDVVNVSFLRKGLYLVLALPFDLLAASAADQIGFPVSASSYSSLKSLLSETRSLKYKLCYSALNNMWCE